MDGKNFRDLKVWQLGMHLWELAIRCKRYLVRAVHGRCPPQAVLGPAFTPGFWRRQSD